jgi:hypothetical protein
MQFACATQSTSSEVLFFCHLPLLSISLSWVFVTKNRLRGFSFYFFAGSSCLLAFRQRVQSFTRPPPSAVGTAAHWRLGYLRLFPVGLNLVARTRFE